MNRTAVLAFGIVVLVLSVVASPAQAVFAPPIIGVSLGTDPPPTMLGPYEMLPFGPDTRPLYDFVSTADVVRFSYPVEHDRIGNGWATWSNGYTGDVYWTNGGTSLTLTLPAYTKAFYFYVEPDPFGEFVITAIANDGAQVVQTVNGDSGAAGYGFYVSDPISFITIDSDVDFAVGEFGINVPEPCSLIVWSLLGACGAGLGVWRSKAA